MSIEELIEVGGQDCPNCGNSWRQLVPEMQSNGESWHNSVAAGSPRIIEACKVCGDEAFDIYERAEIHL